MNNAQYNPYKTENEVVEDSLVEFRYIRPCFEDRYDEESYGINDNLHGITVKFSVDYLTRVVYAGWTVCENVNFSKEVGRSRADNAYTWVEFHLDDVTKHKGLVNAFINTLNEKYPKYRTVSYQKLNLKTLEVEKVHTYDSVKKLCIRALRDVTKDN